MCLVATHRLSCLEWHRQSQRHPLSSNSPLLHAWCSSTYLSYQKLEILSNRHHAAQITDRLLYWEKLKSTESKYFQPMVWLVMFHSGYWVFGLIASQSSIYSSSDELVIALYLDFFGSFKSLAIKFDAPKRGSLDDQSRIETCKYHSIV